MTQDNSQKFYEMKNPTRFNGVEIWNESQGKALGEILSTAISQGRGFEVKQGTKREILVPVTPADDLGHVYHIGAHGGVADIGVTEVVGK